MTKQSEDSSMFCDAAQAAIQLSLMIERGEWKAQDKGSVRSDSVSPVIKLKQIAGIGRLPYPKNKKAAAHWRYLHNWLDGCGGSAMATLPVKERLIRYSVEMLKMKDEPCQEWTGFRVPKKD